MIHYQIGKLAGLGDTETTRNHIGMQDHKRGFTCRNCGGGDRCRVAIYRPFGDVSLSLNRTVTCMVLKANDRRTSCPCHDEFRGPRSDYVRQVALATTTTTTLSETYLYIYFLHLNMG
ncbi:uncharacterized protein TNCV_791551 [Trichonephila clavipes]|nr:uncharacterized protein TNCV_791551 [Trichonephila clavipes]